MRIRRALSLALLLLGGVMASGTSVASAALLSLQSIGVNSAPYYANGQLVPTDMKAASSAGAGTVRMELEQQSDPDAADPYVTLAAEAHLRVAPILGLSQQLTPSAAATAMASYVTAFAQRYGPGGSFWAANPRLPYLPVNTYEIGNEPNMPLGWVQDETNLHWPGPNDNPYVPPDPSDYAQVYEASEAALHAVDPTGVALVGGLGDSGSLGVDLQHDEAVLAALDPSTVDAVGFHPYLWQTYGSDFSTMSSDVVALRGWMNANGMQNAPIEINEVGACSTAGSPGCDTAFSSADWGSFIASYMQWALCTPSLGVSSFSAFYWGAQPNSASSPMLSLVSSTGSVTPYGQDYLAAARTLTRQGCSSDAPAQPTPPVLDVGAPANSSPTHATMLLRLRSAHARGHRLLVVVREVPGSGHLTVVAVRGRHRVRLRLIRREDPLLTFATRLPAGRWTLIVSCAAPAGYARPAQLRHAIRIGR